MYSTQETQEKLKTTQSKLKRTKLVYDWLHNADNEIKMRFKLNWRQPHTLFNIACIFFGGHKDLQNIDWYEIYHKGQPHFNPGHNCVNT